MRKLVLYLDGKAEEAGFSWSRPEIIERETTLALFKKEYVPQPKDRLFIDPNCTVPRFKVRGFCEKHGSSISKTMDKANVVFGYPDKMFDSYFYSGHPFSECMRAPFLNYLRKLPVHLVGTLITELENDIHDTFYMDWHCQHKLSNFGIYGSKYYLIDADDAKIKDLPTSSINSLVEVGTNRMYRTPELEAEFLSLVSKGLYHQDALINLINKDSAKIDEAMYQSLRTMFGGSPADQQIAMEAMANSDPDASMVYLLLLCKEFHSALYNHPAKHHVNFKSLTQYLGFKRYEYSLTLDDIVDRLKEKGLLTSANMSLIMDQAKELVRASGETEHFIATDVVPTPEIIEIMVTTDAKNALIVEVPALETPLTAM